MSRSRSRPDPSTDWPSVDRRTDPVSDRLGAALRRAKGALTRPIALERRGADLHFVLVERRRSPKRQAEAQLSELRDELRARLLALDSAETARVLRPLAQVHERLGRKGWAGLDLLSARTLGLALVQAEMLVTQEPSPGLALLVERLRVAKAGADAREARRAEFQRTDFSEAVEVSEATPEEFDATDWHVDEDMLAEADTAPTPLPADPDR